MLVSSKDLCFPPNIYVVGAVVIYSGTSLQDIKVSRPPSSPTSGNTLSTQQDICVAQSTTHTMQTYRVSITAGVYAVDFGANLITNE